jgi:uncharacterized OB-fold protein
MVSNSKKEADIRFGKFGTVGFTTRTKVNDFIDYLLEGKVMASRCRQCDAVFFPPRADCCHCLADDMQWREVTGTGKLVTYSRLSYAPIGFEEDLPYTIAMLNYGDFNIFGRLDSAIPEDDITIGMPMTTAANPLPNGNINYIFKKA